MRAAALVVLLVTETAVTAKAPATEALGRAFEAQPGGGVMHGDDGSGPHAEWRKSGVFCPLERRDGKEDRDGERGAGAVLCTCRGYSLVRDALDDGPSGRCPDPCANIDRDILAIERFIVAGSVRPTTATELRGQAAAERARM